MSCVSAHNHSKRKYWRKRHRLLNNHSNAILWWKRLLHNYTVKLFFTLIMLRKKDTWINLMPTPLCMFVSNVKPRFSLGFVLSLCNTLVCMQVAGNSLGILTSHFIKAQNHFTDLWQDEPGCDLWLTVWDIFSLQATSWPLNTLAAPVFPVKKGKALYSC